MPTRSTTPSGTDAREHRPPVHGLARLIARVSGADGFVFIFFALTGTGYGMAFTHQGVDIVASLAGDAYDPSTVLGLLSLCLATFILGFQGWFWARACVEIQFGPRSRWKHNLLLVWAPRVFAVIPFGFLFWALREAYFQYHVPSWGSWALAGSGAALLVFIVARQDLTLRLRRQADRLRAHGHPRKANALDAALSRMRPLLMAAGVIVWLLLLVLFTVDPVSLPLRVGPCPIVLLCTALLIPVMATFIQWGRRIGLRATEWVLIVVLVVGTLVDNHTIRLLPAPPQPAFRNLAQDYGDWRAQASMVGARRPIIFVAVPGGASRAGFWAGEVLSRLEEMSGGQFSRHVFAISSVSGGSVGAVGFLASLDDPAPRYSLHARVGDFTARDFLSPSFASGAFPDLFQRIFPAPVFPDRAEALERGFEVGWSGHCEVIGGCRAPDLLQHGFLSSWRGSGGWRPILAINGVQEETGGLVLTSTARLTGDVKADDFNDVTRHDVRLSTAIANGARFPYISPPGTYFGYVKTDSIGHADKRAKFGHIIDGGYFDTAGVETIRQLARSLFARADAPSDEAQPIYLIIANGDPPEPVDPRKAPKTADLAPDVFGPLRGFFSAGGAHGALLTRALVEDPPRTKNPDNPPRVITIRLCRKGAPMDWVLSKPSVRFMRGQLGGSATDDPCGNYALMCALTASVGAVPPANCPKPQS